MKYQDLIPSSDSLTPIRRELYHSEGSGFYVFREFLDKLHADHLIRFWTDEIPRSKKIHTRLSKLDKPKNFYRNCGNYWYNNKFGNTYLNFLWNEPVDEVTYGVSWKIIELRNMVMERNFFHEVFPSKENLSCSFNIVQTMEGEEIVPWHNDWSKDDSFDPAALQATLILSEHGKDYNGDGLLFKQNNGETICLNKDLDLKKGDLILWRYNNDHAVMNITTSGSQLGFVRMILPRIFMYPTPIDKKLLNLTIPQMVSEIKRRTKVKFRKVLKGK